MPTNLYRTCRYTLNDPTIQPIYFKVVIVAGSIELKYEARGGTRLQDLESGSVYLRVDLQGYCTMATR